MSEPEPMNQHLSPGTERLLEEVRSVTPRIDWSRVEARLFDEHGAVRDAQVIRGRFGVAQIAAGLAIAASFTLALVSPSREVKQPTQSVAIARAPLTESDGFGHRVLHVGDVIEVGQNGNVLRAEGRLEAHLAPGSRVTILDDGERLLLSLERGSIAASVVPVAGGEPFAIDVAGRRVAVHGTKLVVVAPSSSNGGVVQVAVSEGSAVVGNNHGDGRTEGMLVPAGAIGRFGASPSVVRDASGAEKLVDAGLLAGTKTASNEGTSPTMDDEALVAQPPNADGTLPEPKLAPVAPKVPSTNAEPSSTGVGNALPTTDVAPPSNTTVEPAPVGKGLETAQVAPTMSKLLGAIGQCVPRTSAGVSFSISTKMTLSIDPAGAIDSVSFDDAPLDTKLAACVRSVVAKFSFPAATAKTTVTRSVVLGDKK